jgi:hypothetical protein
MPKKLLPIEKLRLQLARQEVKSAKIRKEIAAIRLKIRQN